jgi:hypothetical protein
MRTDIAIDEVGNFQWASYGIRPTSGLAEYVTQKLQIRLRFLYQEYFLDVTKGLPYLTDFAEKTAVKTIVDARLKKEIRVTYGVAEILSFRSAVDNATRYWSVAFMVKLVDETTLELALNGLGV